MMELPMADRPPLSSLQTTIRLIVGTIGLIFVTGMFAGFFQAMNENGGSVMAIKPLLVLAVFALIGLGFVALITDAIRRRETADGPVAPREKRNRRIMWLSILIGMLVGAFGAISGLFDSLMRPDTFPINPVFAGLFLVFLIVVMPPLTWFWFRSMDEHEREAYRDGAVVSAHAYMLIVPIWWVGDRLGILPPMDGIAVFMAFNLIYLAVWLWRRFR